MSAGRRRAATESTLRGDLVFLALLVGVAVVSAWPIYADWHLILLAVVASALGAALAVVAARRHWGVAATALCAVVIYLTVGVPLAVPTALTSLGDAATGWVSLVTGTALSWKQLATITTIPVGSYQTLLVPALVVFLAGSLIAMTIAVRFRRAPAAPVAMAMTVFGIVFGSPSVSGDAHVGGLVLGAPRELVVGLAAFLIGDAWLLWRAYAARRAAVRAAQSVAGMRQGREAAVSTARRVGLGVAVVAVAAVVGSIAAPAIAGSTPRDVLRSSVAPPIREALTHSPLIVYRSYFADDRYSTPLLTYSTTAQKSLTLRLAVLDQYDGQTFSALNADGATTGSYVRVPFRLDPDASGPSASTTVTVGAGLAGSTWVPTAPNLQKIAFTGARARAAASDFFYNASVGAGVDAATGGTGLREGDSYRLDFVDDAPVANADLARTTPLSEALTPASLKTWVSMQSDTKGLADLIQRLRLRGFLTHDILPEKNSKGAYPQWVQDAYGSSAASTVSTLPLSYAGESVSRVDTLFAQLVDMQKRAGSGSTALVAAIGDDEQFATAAALLARFEGYESRVVVGVRLGGELSKDDIPACANGTCTGANLAAWVEVRTTDGGWEAFDTTPQHSQPIAQQQETQNPPRLGTGVDPESAQREQPGSGDQSSSNAGSSSAPPATTDLAWLVTTLKIVGISLLALLVIVAPFATILVAKARRRRARRFRGPPEARIVGGWDEYVDAALDHGHPLQSTRTRAQLASEFGTTHGIALADIADRAVFGPVDPDEEESQAFWQLVENDRLEFARGMGRFRRWRAIVSLRSFARGVRESARGMRATVRRRGR